MTRRQHPRCRRASPPHSMTPLRLRSGVGCAMRITSLLASSLALLLAASSAAASVTEPDGKAVPQASVDPVQLNTLFSNLGEPIDWKVDAASTPNAFSPLCGFTAKFLAHGADCPLD